MQVVPGACHLSMLLLMGRARRSSLTGPEAKQAEFYEVGSVRSDVLT
jgi:hypothetical protein